MAEKKDLFKWAIIENIVITISAVSLAVFLVWFTKSPWGLLGLLMLIFLNPDVKFRQEKTDAECECPKCGHQFKLTSQ